MAGGEPKESLNALVDLEGGEPGGLLEVRESEGLVEVFANVVEDFGEFFQFDGAIHGGGEVAGEAGEADDLAGVIMEGFFPSEAPTAFAAGIEMELEAAGEVGAARDEGEILPSIVFAKGGGEEVEGGFAN